MKERANVSFRVSKFNVREYMRKRHLRKQANTRWKKWFSSLNDQEKRDLNDELNWRIKNWMFVDEIIPPSIPDEIRHGLRYM